MITWLATLWPWSEQRAERRAKVASAQLPEGDVAVLRGRVQAAMQRSRLTLPDVVEAHEPSPEVAALARSLREVATRGRGAAESRRPSMPAVAASEPPSGEVRTRFAPSPTGQLHIGGARTALMNYLFAKRLGGEFVLRIEDTDLPRSRRTHTASILGSLRALGITWQGEVVHQSRRSELYARKIDVLIDRGAAYRDETGAVWFKVPKEGDVIVHDRVKGSVRVSLAGDAMRDYVIQRADGTATFLLANVVDDGEQKITHVIRGDDHLANVVKQIPLFRALGYPVPQFAHVPLILDEDGEKLSKRKGATGVLDFLGESFDPTILVNHLARLGLRIRTDEMLPLDELAKAVDPWGFKRAPARIDLPKLRARNREQVLRLSLPELVEQAAACVPDLAERLGPTRFIELCEATRTRISTFGEIAAIAAAIEAAPAALTIDDTAAVAGARDVIDRVAECLAALPAEQWSTPHIDSGLRAMVPGRGRQSAPSWRALRLMLTGDEVGLGVAATMALLGRDVTLTRLRRAV